MSSAAWRRIALASALAATLVVAAAGQAAASCELPPPIEQAIARAHTVFVGTVTALQHDGRVARFNVDEIWKGELGSLAVVTGGPTVGELEAAAADGLGIATSVDRTYELGTRYLVVAHGADADSFLDSACSVTQPFTADLDQYRPEGAHVPPTDPPPQEAKGTGAWLWIVGVTVIAGGGVVAVALLRRRNRPWSGAPA